MGYSEKFEIVKNTIIDECKERVKNNWHQMFDMYLSCEACMEFPDIYKDAFRSEFDKYITSDVELVLFISGKNLVYAIEAHMTADSSMNDILSFTHDFIEGQLDDFDNACDDISSAMYEESSECERDNTIVEATRAVTDVSGNVPATQ
jgi:hypothetical protein